MRAPTIWWLLLRSRKTDLLVSRANQETAMPDELAAEKGAGSDAVSTLSNYLAIRDGKVSRTLYKGLFYRAGPESPCSPELGEPGTRPPKILPPTIPLFS